MDIEALLTHLRAAEAIILDKIKSTPGYLPEEVHECKIAIWKAMDKATYLGMVEAALPGVPRSRDR